MERRDPIAYVLSGIGYKATGCGLRGGYLAHGKIPSAFCRLIRDSRYWLEEVIGPEGARLAIPVSVAVDNTERPCCGITWIFPPTLANSAETTSS